MQVLRPDEVQPDAAFMELKRPYGMVHRVLSILYRVPPTRYCRLPHLFSGCRSRSRHIFL